MKRSCWKWVRGVEDSLTELRGGQLKGIHDQAKKRAIAFRRAELKIDWTRHRMSAEGPGGHESQRLSKDDVGEDMRLNDVWKSHNLTIISHTQRKDDEAVKAKRTLFRASCKE